jgi:hypothetical protein
MKYKSGAMYEG